MPSRLLAAGIKTRVEDLAEMIVKGEEPTEPIVGIEVARRLATLWKDGEVGARARVIWTHMVGHREGRTNHFGVQVRRGDKTIESLPVEPVTLPREFIADLEEAGRLFLSKEAMGPEQRDVADFHRAMDQAILPKPSIPDHDIVVLRARLVTEEFGEFIGALTGSDDAETERLVSYLHGLVRGYLDKGGKPDLPGLADAIEDLKYVLLGTNLAFGINGAPVWSAVHAANMAKAGGPVSPEGKRLKPPGWTPPDIEGVLRAQGWDPASGGTSG